MIHVLIAGPPCRRCDEAERRVRQVVEDRRLDCCIERVSDFSAIVALQVYAVPGLVVDGALKSVGRVPETAELIDWLSPRGQETAGRSGSGPIPAPMPGKK